MVKLLPIDPATYVPHALHTNEESAWPETNCYVDLFIEVLHGLGLEPLASLGFTLLMDWEGEQWSFFKFQHHDLLRLYGLEVQEHAIWRPLEDHIEEQVAMGRSILIELDSFYLPDTRGTAYGAEHVKTTVAVNRLDREKREMDYFHNKGFFTLSGEDYAKILYVEPPGHTVLPPYVEVVKIDKKKTLAPAALREASIACLKEHYARRPSENPFTLYRPRFKTDLAWLKTQPLATYHLYAFATLRQIGANFELASEHMKWLAGGAEGLAAGGSLAAAFASAAEDFRQISDQAKSLQFKLARAVQGKKPIDEEPMMAAMEASWARAMNTLGARLEPT